MGMALLTMLGAYRDWLRSQWPTLKQVSHCAKPLAVDNDQSSVDSNLATEKSLMSIFIFVIKSHFELLPTCSPW